MAAEDLQQQIRDLRIVLEKLAHAVGYPDIGNSDTGDGWRELDLANDVLFLQREVEQLKQDVGELKRGN